jgi:hypothetical protein
MSPSPASTRPLPVAVRETTAAFGGLVPLRSSVYVTGFIHQDMASHVPWCRNWVPSPASCPENRFDTWHFEFQHNLGIDGPLWQYLIVSFRLFWGPYGVLWYCLQHCGTHNFGIPQTSVSSLSPAAPSTLAVSLSRQSDTASTQSICSLNPPWLIVKIIIPRPQPNLDP